jgi:hypothetical protein
MKTRLYIYTEAKRTQCWLYPIHAIKAWNYFMYIFHRPNIPKLQQQLIVWPCLVQAKCDCLFPKKYIQKYLHHINKWPKRILKLIVENLSMEWEIKLHINTLKLTIAPISTSIGSTHNGYEFFHYLTGRLFVKFNFSPRHKVNNWIFFKLMELSSYLFVGVWT